MHEIDTQAREGTIAALMRDDQDLTRDQAEALYDAAPDAASAPADDRPPITIPDHLKAEIEIILAAYRGVSLNIADRLINAGLENSVAANLAICAMMTEAARTGALFAHAFEKREPRRDWWLISAAEHFDAAGQWYAEAFGKAATEVDGQ